MKQGGFILILAAICLLNRVWTAKRIDAHLRARETMKQRQRRAELDQTQDRTALDTTELFKLTRGESLEEGYEFTDVSGATVVRLHETYNGIPVYDTAVTVRKSKDGELIGDATGTIIQEIEEDLPDTEAILSDINTLAIAIEVQGDEMSNIAEIEYDRKVYFDKHNHARLVNIVSYLTDDIKRPFVIIDVKNGEILKTWQGLTTLPCCERNYKARGGNSKMGRITYGDMPYCLTPTVVNGTCYLENQYVRVIDMLYSHNYSITETASFDCEKGYGDAINGAYSPAIDAFFYGTVVGKMFEEWFQSTPLRDKIILRVHYGVLVPRAFWTGKYSVFGDGDFNAYYPLTLPDVVGHEVGHGVTEQASALAYFSEHGGVNEAFSDILGEATEEYLLHSDFVSGQYVMKALPYKREFQTPENDNVSISNVDDMCENIDVHYSSGVYRRVWYIVTKKEGMPIRDATTAFLHANKVYWHSKASFFECSCGLLRAALDLGYDTLPFRKAFSDVGIKECDINSHVVSLSKNITKHDVILSGTINPVFKMKIPEWADTFTANVVSNNSCPTLIIVTKCGWELSEDNTNVGELVAEGMGSVEIPNAANKTLFVKLSILVDSKDFNCSSTEGEEVKYVDLTAGYTCLPLNSTSAEYMIDCNVH